LQSQAEFSQYEDEDYDVFRDKVPASGKLGISWNDLRPSDQVTIGSGQNMQTLQLSMRLSNKSWIAGDDDSDDEDPFADVRIYFSFLVAANLCSVRRTLCRRGLRDKPPA
jgi:hypothetical protein